MLVYPTFIFYIRRINVGSFFINLNATIHKLVGIIFGLNEIK